MDTHELLDAAGLRPGEADLLIGGPPCTRSARAATGLSTSALARTRTLTFSTITCVSSARRDRASSSRTCSASPTAITMPFGSSGFSRLSGAGVPRRIASSLAADYGVPQRRQRLFILGSKDREPEFPEPTHSGPHETRRWDESCPRHVTTGEAIGDLVGRTTSPSPGVGEGTYGHLLPSPAWTTTTCSTPTSAATRSRCSAGGSGTGSFLLAGPRAAVTDDPSATWPVGRPFHWATAGSGFWRSTSPDVSRRLRSSARGGRPSPSRQCGSARFSRSASPLLSPPQPRRA